MEITEQQFQLLRAGGFAIALAAGLALQRWLPHERQRGSWPVNASLWILNGAVIGVVCGACACAAARWAEGRGLGVLNVAPLPPWIAVCVTVAVLDLVSYGWHRANHVVGFLWRVHRVHHSDRRFTVTTGVRFHPGELLLSLPIRLTAVVLLGAPLYGVLAFELAFTVANLIEHGDIDYPRRLDTALGRLFVTPALHRCHHTDQRPELDSNFGTVFSVWDRLLGTYRHSTPGEAIKTGAPGIEHSLRLFEALRLPFAPRIPV
jgi:sterol desaturase/sphingolipid hydroxylase (fatty acid hydroxylase superfamily)